MTEAALKESPTATAAPQEKQLLLECFRSEKPVIFCTGGAFSRRRNPASLYSTHGAT